MKAAGYLRVSLAKQVVNGVSIDVQQSKIEAYCQLKDIELVDVICDAGKSGAKSSREGYQAVLGMCDRGEVDAVIVYSLSRFSRSTRDLLDFVDAYVMKMGIDFHSLSESFDTSTPVGRAMLKIMGVMNELEREQVGQRTSAAMQFKKENGEYTGGHVPFGKELASDGVTLIDNPDEQIIIGRIENLHTRGFSYNAIAKALNIDGYTTKTGKKWTYKQVQRIVQNAA